MGYLKDRSKTLKWEEVKKIKEKLKKDGIE